MSVKMVPQPQRRNVCHSLSAAPAAEVKGERWREWMETEFNVAKKSFKHRHRSKYPLFCLYGRTLIWIHSLIWISLRLGSWTLSTLSKDENAVQLSRQQTVSVVYTVPGGLHLIFSLSTSCKSDICLAVLLMGYSALVLFFCRLNQQTAAEMMFSSVTFASLYLVLRSGTELNYKVPEVILFQHSSLDLKAMHGM